MDPESNARSIGLAFEWVAKITMVGLVMVLPAAGGQYLDRRWGTGFLGLLGLLFGVVAGVWQLLRMVRVPQSNK
jgi:F0F1-type ATP synthase assembly protein I